MELSKKIEAALEKHDFAVCGEISERTYRNDGYDVELETSSPEGEDVIVSLIFDGTEKDFIRQFKEYAKNFDVEGHAEMWINCRGKNGVPSSIEVLLNDAKWIKNTLENVADDLEGIENKTGTPKNKDAAALNKRVRMVIEFDIDTESCEQYGIEGEEILNSLRAKESDIIDGFVIYPEHAKLDVTSDFVLGHKVEVISKEFVGRKGVLEKGAKVEHFKRELLSDDERKNTLKYCYEVVGIAIHTETDEEMVIYQALYPNEDGKYLIFSRPLQMFLGCVNKEKYPSVSRECVFQILQE